ncbi:MAG TPA: thermonuclease family protein [Hanamia sp.]|nr:thermonuclease family protein [Hanamia sp.]
MKFFLFYTLVFLGWPVENVVVKNDPSLTAKVIKIVDGDTFDVLTKSNEVIRIRMNGIDCPERRQDYYQVCKDALSNYIFSRDVQLTVHGKDRYKRTIADVFYQDKNINLLMIRNGFAWHYKKYSTDAGMAKAEEKARRECIGLWKIKRPVAPWDFRKARKKQLPATSK